MFFQDRWQDIPSRGADTFLIEAGISEPKNWKKCREQTAVWPVSLASLWAFLGTKLRVPLKSPGSSHHYCIEGFKGWLLIVLPLCRETLSLGQSIVSFFFQSRVRTLQ